jgi:hypothetical protein
MKKAIMCVLPLMMVIMGCASGRAVVEINSNSPGMDLDAAIREAAAQMETRIPPKTMVALVSVASPSTVFSTQVLTRLESTIVSNGKLVVVDRANLDKVREEQGFQLSGEVDDESAKSIGKLLGAGAIVTGSLADLGDVYSLTLKAINIETATVAVSYLADLAKSARIETLLASGGGATSGATSNGAGTGTRTVQAGGRATPVPAPAAPPVPAYKIGDIGPAGGIVFYDKFSSAGGWRYLEAAPKEIEQKLGWGNFHIELITDVGAGKRNTQIIVNEGKNLVTAARFCFDLEYGGYDDWFLPSKDELNLMYENLKVKRQGDFVDDIYWSSSYKMVGNYWGPWLQNFSDGSQETAYFIGKTTALSVRAIRQF